ncbi:MAG TPA: TrpB-like pyridoxal phosphate-dependent enzyme [Candidatus Bilamarchaeum sp.]|nr:TrpB-like pyridoxal phosphate-dependent enzyme [Candidatus Bilamarchaeum sp.]
MNSPKIPVPKAWRNFLSDFIRHGIELPVPGRIKGGKIEPYPAAELAKITSGEAARIETLQEPYRSMKEIEIPKEVYDVYVTYRPTPLYRASGLEMAVAAKLGKSSLEYASIWVKDESGTPSGSHKLNTALPQALYAKMDGRKKVVTDTGAGQWGIAVAIAARRLGLRSRVFMTAQSYRDKKGRVAIMEENGAEVISSPSDKTAVGRSERAKDQNHPGSLGIGMSEAVSTVDKDTALLLGCMSYYAALHQSIIGLEVAAQLAALKVEPDVLVACIGGGSNFCGLVAPYIDAKLGGKGPLFVAAESANIPVLTQGRYDWDYQDHGELMPLLLMNTLGHENVPPKLHAGGLRYHGKNPVLSMLHSLGHVKAVALDQKAVLKAGLEFQKAQGFLPAPESAHAILAAMEEAAAAERRKKKRNIVFLLTGDGKFDSVAYESLRNP